ncbi:hypothetical protein [Rhodococcus sp. (in: high G+C Gram-positive bacteria)]|uniref:hypothetical protein n=1 Tax=Rhodococcus sp. TaxID=1831 RepID=UPI00388EE37C
MALEEVPLDADGSGRQKVYGTLKTYGLFLVGNALMVFANAALVSVLWQASADPGPYRFAPGPSFVADSLGAAIAFGILTGLVPICFVLMHSPRTRRSDILVGTDEGIPALLLRRSRLLFNLSMFVALPAVTAMVVFLVRAAESGPSRYPADRDFDLGTWALVLLVTCGYQAGVGALILLGRIRPGYIAVRHDGLHLRGYALDAWIPWDSLSIVQANTHWKSLLVCLRPDNQAVLSSRVPRLWRGIDKTVTQLRSPIHGEVVVVFVDRRPFRISPEIIDAAVEHYMENPDARRELRDPEAIARTVEVLRSHATTAWWRSQRRPVPVPRLVPDSPGRDEILRKWNL